MSENADVVLSVESISHCVSYKELRGLKYQNVFLFVYDSFLDRQTGVSCPFWADRCRTSSSANSTSVSVTYRRPAADL